MKSLRKGRFWSALRQGQELGDHMGTIFTPEVLVVLAGGTFVMGYLTINQVWLRIFVLAGTVLYIWYYATVADAPLWEAIYTSMAMGAANLFGLMSLMAQRSRMIVPAQHRDIYPQFGNLTPGDFRALVRCADRFTTDTEIELATEGSATEHLYFLIKGTARVQKLGVVFVWRHSFGASCVRVRDLFAFSPRSCGPAQDLTPRWTTSGPRAGGGGGWRGGVGRWRR